MIQLTTKINHRVSGVVICCCLIVVALIVGYYWISINAQLVVQNQPLRQAAQRATEIRAGRPHFFEIAQTLKRYGNWPIVDVSLSPDRGNPFVPK